LAAFRSAGFKSIRHMSMCHYASRARYGAAPPTSLSYELLLSASSLRLARSAFASRGFALEETAESFSVFVGDAGVVTVRTALFFCRQALDYPLELVGFGIGAFARQRGGCQLF